MEPASLCSTKKMTAWLKYCYRATPNALPRVSGVFGYRNLYHTFVSNSVSQSVFLGVATPHGIPSESPEGALKVPPHLEPYMPLQSGVQ